MWLQGFLELSNYLIWQDQRWQFTAIYSHAENSLVTTLRISEIYLYNIIWQGRENQGVSKLSFTSWCRDVHLESIVRENLAKRINTSVLIAQACITTHIEHALLD